MKNAQSKDLIVLKILLLGGLSGKTSILQRYCDNCFSENFLATIFFEDRNKIIQFNNYNIKLIIWDTARQERITRQFILGADGIIFVCDITDYHSLNHMISFIELENDINQNSEKIICANRCDLEEKREIPKEEIEKYGISQNMEVFETSAKTGKNINEAFQRLVELIIRKKEIEKEIIEQMNNEKLLFNFRIDLISSQIYNSQKRIFNLFCDNAGYSLGRKILEFYKHKISLMIYINNIKNIIEKDYFLGKIKSEKDGIIYIFDLYGNSTFEYIKNIKSALEQRNEYNSERIIVLKINDSDNKTKELSKIIENYAISLEIKVFIIDKINYEIVSEIFYELISLILKNKVNPRIYESFNQHIIDNIYKFRFAILGDKYSGKSEIFKEYSNFKEQRLKILDINKYKIKLEIYDIDETNILELLNKYKINGIIFIFSPDSLESFEKVKEFINEIKKNYINEYQNIICVNKNNINGEIMPKEMNTYLIEQKMDIIEINSKIKDIVDKILVKLAYQILLKKKNNQIITDFYNFNMEYLPIHNYEKKLNKYLDF